MTKDSTAALPAAVFASPKGEKQQIIMVID